MSGVMQFRVFHQHKLTWVCVALPESRSGRPRLDVLLQSGDVPDPTPPEGAGWLLKSHDVSIIEGEREAVFTYAWAREVSVPC